MNIIKNIRKKKQMTVRDLAESSNISVGYLSDLENCKTENPTKETMDKIAVALETTVPELFYGTSTEDKS
ncbi:helix-turn-helix domain-containing protein [Clostridium butyricum]|uniref:helix-turn-helix domain-containing protein n=1 Tax=Clostridium butyricum TaxID=1492 RepID=UPI003466055C